MECILTVVSRVSVTARPGWTKTRRLYTFWFCLSERASVWCCTRSLRRGRPSPWTRRYTSSPPSSGASSPPDRHRSRKRSPEERNKQDKLKTHRSRVRKMIQNLHSPAQCKKIHQLLNLIQSSDDCLSFLRVFFLFPFINECFDHARGNTNRK